MCRLVNKDDLLDVQGFDMDPNNEEEEEEDDDDEDEVSYFS